jgi:hypothetical protein
MKKRKIILLCLMIIIFGCNSIYNDKLFYVKIVIPPNYYTTEKMNILINDSVQHISEKQIDKNLNLDIIIIAQKKSDKAKFFISANGLDTIFNVDLKNSDTLFLMHSQILYQDDNKFFIWTQDDMNRMNCCE